MRQKHLLTKLALLLVMFVGGVTAWAEEETIVSFSNSENTGWTINGNPAYTNSGGYQLVASTMSIVTPSITWSNYSDIKITIKARKYGGPNATQGKISVSQGETELLSVSPTSTTLTNYGPSAISPVDGTITISCPGASSSKGCGISEITITGTQQTGTYTVTYDANGATSGTVPTDATEYDADNNTVTVLGNTGGLAKEHYTFSGWNTKADGSGTSYVADATFTITANTKLYAQWAINTHNVALPATDEFGTYTMSAENPVAYGTEVTLTYTPATGFEKYAATWSVNGEEIAKDKFAMPDEAVTVTVSVKKVTISDMAIDFEDNTSTYTDWTFTNINGKATDSGVTPHGGTYFGVTAGTATASIVTKEKVDPVSLTCYVSKKSTNTSSSTWYIQVSEDGNTWTEVSNCNGANMSKGEWKELTATLKDYTDVYVRVYYSGSTAVRCIDDLTLTVNGSAKPSISASDVNLAYNATSGNVNFTLTNEVEGGIVTATKEGDWITLGEVGATSVSFTATANETSVERTATITLTYSYGESETISKVVTVTQAAAPIIYVTIPALFEAATSTAADVNVTFGNWVVSGISTNGKSVFVTDGTNGFVIYSSSDQSSTYAVGDILSGTASCSLKLNTGFAQLTDLDANDMIITSGGTVSPANIALDALAGVNTGALVNYTGLTCSVSSGKYYLSDGTTTIQLYNSLYNFGTTFKDGKSYNITGIYQQYNTTKEILPRSAADIVEVVVPTISLSESTINATAAEKSGTITVTYNNLTNYLSEVRFVASDGKTAATYDWLIADINTSDDTKLDYTIGENNSTEARTAYMKVYALGDEGEAYSDLITITQAAPVVTNTYTLATSFTSGKHYVIASGTIGDVKVMGSQKDNNRAAVGGNVSGTTLNVTSDAGATEFIIYGPDANGYYTIYDAAKGYLYAAGSGSGNNYLRSQTTFDNNGKWSVSIDGSGEATVVAQGLNTNKYMRFNSTLFSCYGDGSSVKDLVYFYEKDGEATPTETIHVTDAKYATYCSENALDFEGTGLTAYVADQKGTSLTFEPVTKVPAYTGVLLKANAAGDYTIPATSSFEGAKGSDLKGVIVETKITEAGIFVLMKGEKGVGFYKTTSTGFTVGAHTAYLPNTMGLSRDFIAIDEATAINGIAAEKASNGEIYNLQGQRVTKAQKGLYIMDGKKVLVK